MRNAKPTQTLPAILTLTVATLLLCTLPLTPTRAQDGAPPPPPPPGQDGPPGPGGFGPGGPGGFFGGRPGGFGMGGPMGQPQRKLLAQFDADKNGWLDKQERAAAREFLKNERKNAPAQGQRRFGPPMMQNAEPAKPGPHVSPSDVQSYPSASLYAPLVLRTFFLEFEEPDWEAELVDFHKTDVDVAATLIVDGKRYPNVGVHFRGMSSYMMVPSGSKRSLNLSLDMADKKQRLYGHRTLNLLNAHEDPTFMHPVLYSMACRDYIPAPDANLAKVVINGESWGVYDNVEQFNSEFTKKWFGSAKGARWKVPGSPRGGGGLVYSGEDLSEYKRHFEIKTADDEKSWKKLVELCRVLNQTPPEHLEAAISPILDLDGVLWFLALDNALVNNDGYWVRDSDFSIYLDPSGVFHIFPSDMNETYTTGGGPPPGMGRRGPGGPGGPGGEFRPGGFGPGGQGGGRGGPGGPGGPGRRGGPPGGSIDLDPLVALNDNTKPLRSKLLNVPALRARYLSYVRAVAEEWLDWKKLAPIVEQRKALIEKEVAADTRKLESYDAFEAALSNDPQPKSSPNEGRPTLSLRQFVEQRQKYLLSRPDVTKAQAQAVIK